MNKRIILIVTAVVITVAVALFLVFKSKEIKVVNNDELSIYVDFEDSSAYELIRQVSDLANIKGFRIKVVDKLNKDTDIVYSTYSSNDISRIGRDSLTLLDSGFNSKVLGNLKNIEEIDNGNYYFYPITWSSWGIYYNREVFKNNKIKEPKDINQMYKVFDNFKSRGITPISMVSSYYWPLTAWWEYSNIRDNGSTFHKDLLAGKVDFESKRVKELYVELFSLIENNYFSDSDNNNWRSMVADLESGKTPMLLGGSFIYKELSSSDRDNIGWIPFPAGKNSDEIISSSGFYITGDEDKIESIKEFLTFTTSYKLQDYINTNSPFLPVNRKVMRSENKYNMYEAYKNIQKASNLITVLDRNSNGEIIYPIKWSILSLFHLKSGDDIDTLLEKLESERIKE